MAACSGTTGSPGATGAPGAQGPPAPSGTALNVSTATSMVATITSVTVPSAPPIHPVVKFLLVDQAGQPLQGLKASNLGFAIAKLVPAGVVLKPVPPSTIAPTSVVSTQWQSYLYQTASPAPGIVGQMPEPQATTEGGTGTFTDNGDGTYQYTFAKDVSADPAVSYDAALVHRVALEIRDLAPANSPVYTFQPSSGATTDLPLSREIVDDQTCKNCHMLLGLPTQVGYHGGARTEIQYCVMCHNPSSKDPSTGNTLDFKVMFHKIHMGVSLPSVVAGGSYKIYGFMNVVSNYSAIVFPTHDLRTCYTCHNESDPATPQTVNWREVPSVEACGSCHDNVNFATGANHGSNIVADNTECSTCHGTTSNIDNGALQVAAAHVIPERQYQKNFTYNIIQVTNTAPGQTPVLRFSVTNPTNENKAWNLLTDEPFTDCTATVTGLNSEASTASDAILMIAWNTLDYTNTGTGANGGEIDIPVACTTPLPTANGDGTFSITSPQQIPPNVTGTAGIYFNGHPSHNFNDGRGVRAIPVPNATAYSSITDATPVPRRVVADLKKCDVCHDQLNPLAHDSDRVESLTGCPFCHEPNATDQATRALLGVVTLANALAMAPDQLQEQSIDFKIMIHAIHDGPNRGLVDQSPYVVYHNGSVFNFTTITPFPGAVNNCLGCHDAGTFYPPNPSNPTTPLASTIHTVDSTGAPLINQIAITAGAAACSSCHASAVEIAHMEQNGANFAAVKNAANNQVVSNETCVVCHSAGAIADVQLVHNLATYQ
jgi:OmcA/MtrC family decaheme c-type cytochrome